MFISLLLPITLLNAPSIRTYNCPYIHPEDSSWLALVILFGYHPFWNHYTSLPVSIPSPYLRTATCVWKDQMGAIQRIGFCRDLPLHCWDSNFLDWAVLGWDYLPMEIW